MSLFTELKRRNVLRVAGAYVALSWLIIQVIETLFSLFGWSEAIGRIVVIVLAIGFVPALIFAWVFELTPEGLKRDDEVDHAAPAIRQMGKRLDRLMLVALALALAYFAFDKFVLDPTRDAEELATATMEAREEGRTEAIAQVRDNSIAVLAFQDLSPAGDQEYFSDGISEEMLNLLARIPELRVTGKTSAFSFKNKNATIAEIGEVLNVGHVLEGSVRMSGDRIRVTAQLIEAQSDTHIWSRTYDRKLEDIFAVQDEIAAMVVEQLHVTLLGPVPRTQRTNSQTYALTLQARHILEGLSPGTTEQMAALLEEALALDPDYVPAMNWLVHANYYMRQEGLISEEEEMRRYVDLEERVFAIDPDNAQMLTMVAFSALDIDRDVEKAATIYQQAVRYEPGNAEVLRVVGNFAKYIGHNEESIALLERGVELDPLCIRCLYFLSKAYMDAGRLDEAEAARRRYMALGSGGHYYLAVIKLLQGEPAAALTVVEGQDSDYPEIIAARAMALHDLGRESESEEALAILIEHHGGEGSYYLVDVYAWIGNRDAAFEWLEKAYRLDKNYGQYGHRFIRRISSPLWRNLHGDPRWDAMRERVGMSEERLAAIEFEVNLPE